jgi:hypothetical protein
MTRAIHPNNLGCIAVKTSHSLQGFQNMTDSVPVAGWWNKELARQFTRLECGLLGALFASIAIMFMIVMRFMVL